MAAYSGIKGSVKISTNCVGEVKSWTADITYANEDTTVFDCAGSMAAWGQNTLTIKSISGSIECNLDTSDTQQLAMINTIFSTAGTVALVLQPYTGALKLSVTALINSINFSSSATGIASVTFGFVQSGSVVPTFAA